MTIKLGDLLVRLTGDSTSFEKMIDDATRRMTQASEKLTAAGQKMTLAVTTPLAALGAASVKAFSDFDDAMTKSTAIMGDMTAEVRQSMEEQARAISRRSVTSAKDLAEAYFFLASAGLDAEQSIAALPAVEKFAVAGAFDMAKATDLLTDAQSALGLTTKDSNKNLKNMKALSDVLLKANTLANASVEQFSVALVTKSAAAMRLLNKDMEEGVAVLAAFADQGVKAELAGEKLSIVLRDLQTATLKEASTWKKMGLFVFDANEKMLPLADIIEQLEDRFEGLTDKQKKMAAEMLGFQDRSFSAIQTLFGTSQKIRDYEKALRAAGGVTEEVANKQLKSFASQMKIVFNNVVDVSIEIGRTLAPFVAKVAEQIRRFTDFWRSLSEETKGFVVQAAAVAASLGPVLLGMGALIGGVKILSVFFAGLASVLTPTVLGLGAFAGVLLLVSDAIRSVMGRSTTGFLDLVSNIKVGGLRIAEIMTSVWLTVGEVFERTKTGILISWEFWKTAMLNLAGEAKLGLVRAALSVLNAWEKTKNFLTLGFVSNNFKANIEENNKFFNKLIDDSLGHAEGRNREYYGAVTKLEKDLAKLRKKNAKTLEALMSTLDAKEAEKVAQGVDAPATKVPDFFKQIMDSVESMLGKKKDPFDFKSLLSASDALANQKRQEFRVINLQRMSLRDPFRQRFSDPTAAAKKEQQVKAPGLEKKMDKLISVTEKKSNVAILG